MGINLAYEANIQLSKKEFKNPLAYYNQANCKSSLTDEGYRIYRPPNITYNSSDSSTRTMWGGFVLRYPETPFIEGHRYQLIFEVKGQTTCLPSEMYWTNNCGWGGHGLDPQPTNVITKNISANFNSQEWTSVSYIWTISDTIYKTCTSSYSSFVEGQSYNSYRDFKYGFTYQNTGALGTDLYIKNIRMYDITTASKIDIKKTGVINADNFVENLSLKQALVNHSGEFSANQFYEI